MMTAKTAVEVIKYIRDLGLLGANSSVIDEELECAIQALEKQIPKKPIDNLNFAKMSGFNNWIECPQCKKSANGTHFPFCPWCGQALDWSKWRKTI